MGFGIKSHIKGHWQYQYLRDSSVRHKLMGGASPYFMYIGWLGHQNIGDEALFECFRDELFSQSIILPYYDLSLTSIIGRMTRRSAVLLGGGTLINDDNYLIPLERSQRRDRMTFVFGTGVGDLAFWSRHAANQPQRGNQRRWIAALKRAEYVGVRGPRSLSWLESNGITNAEIIGDPALMLQSGEKNSTTKERVIGLNLGSHDPIDGDAENLLHSIRLFCHHAIKLGYRIEYISMSPIDHGIGKLLAPEFQPNNFSIKPFANSTNALMNQISTCDVVVGQRLHVTVLACAAGVPNLSLSYQPKCLDFLESLDRTDLSIPTNEISAASLIERLAWIEKRTEEIKQQLKLSVNSFRSLQRSAARKVLRICEK